MAEPGNNAIYSTILQEEPDMLDLVEDFVAELSNRVAQLESAAAQQDLALLARLAHQLKGASGGYGFQPIGDVAAVLEQSAKSAQHVTEVQKHLADLIAICQCARVAPS